MIFFYFTFLFLKIFTHDLKCKVDFLNAYNIDGEDFAKFEKMLFCPKVTFNCCSPFDEMKFHKNWFNFYQPKMIITIDKA